MLPERQYVPIRAVSTELGGMRCLQKCAYTKYLSRSLTDWLAGTEQFSTTEPSSDPVEVCCNEVLLL